MRKIRDSVYHRREAQTAERERLERAAGMPLSARNLAKHGMRRGAYDGANKRRFVLFELDTDQSTGEGVEYRSEFDTKHERDMYALRKLAERNHAS